MVNSHALSRQRHGCAAPVLYNPASDPEFKRAVRLRESGQLTKAALAFARLAREAHGEGDTAKETRVLLAEGGYSFASLLTATPPKIISGC